MSDSEEDDDVQCCCLAFRKFILSEMEDAEKHDMWDTFVLTLISEGITTFALLRACAGPDMVKCPKPISHLFDMSSISTKPQEVYDTLMSLHHDNETGNHYYRVRKRHCDGDKPLFAWMTNNK